MADLTLRLSDADRESAAQALGEHDASRRLDLEEYDHWLDPVHAARTGADLIAPFEGLPRPAVPVLFSAGAVSAVLFFVCGFAFDGWAWSWLLFLPPGAWAVWRRDHDDQPAPAALPEGGEPR